MLCLPTQATFEGSDTWVQLPRDQWPKGAGWEEYYNPCVKLKLALYGHPLAGLYWENHCKNALAKCGFEPVPGWECLHFNRGKQLFFSVYVDDFKMAGKAQNVGPSYRI